jgi:hypothetical protein
VYSTVASRTADSFRCQFRMRNPIGQRLTGG